MLSAWNGEDELKRSGLTPFHEDNSFFAEYIEVATEGSNVPVFIQSFLFRTNLYNSQFMIYAESCVPIEVNFYNASGFLAFKVNILDTPFCHAEIQHTQGATYSVGTGMDPM